MQNIPGGAVGSLRIYCERAFAEKSGIAIHNNPALRNCSITRMMRLGNHSCVGISSDIERPLIGNQDTGRSSCISPIAFVSFLLNRN